MIDKITFSHLCIVPTFKKEYGWGKAGSKYS